MSSFMFDFVIDMGGSDSGGSIQQPLMNQEVISIGGSSSDDTCHVASDYEFSSSKRLRVSRSASGDTSCFHRLCWTLWPQYIKRDRLRM